MIKLLHTDVDGYNSIRGEWEQNPTSDELRNLLECFHDDVEDAVKDLLEWGEADLNDSSNTRYELI